VVEHLRQRFGGRVAFDDVAFKVGSGEVFGFHPDPSRRVPDRQSGSSETPPVHLFRWWE
jgi:hypothetical protein